MIMSRNFTHQPDESTLTTLCPRCLTAFRNARGIRVRRADPYQLTKEPCTYCQTNFGYDYYTTPSAHNPKLTFTTTLLTVVHLSFIFESSMLIDF